MTPAEGIEGFRGGLLRCFDDALSLAREEGRREGVAAEREACARIADDYEGRNASEAIAERIRARGKGGAS